MSRQFRHKARKERPERNSFSSLIIGGFTVSTLDGLISFVNMVNYGSDLRPWGQPSLYYKLTFTNPLKFSL